jgi:phosphonate transport system ATP-binding protein
MRLIRDMSRDVGVPVLCNIHDLQLALEFADRVVGVQGGEKMFEGRASELDRRALHSIYAGEVL